MTALTVRFFASLRETVGFGEFDIEVDPPTLAGLRSALATKLTAEQFRAIDVADVRIAVNQAIVQGETPLRPGDEVAFLPRVTGG
ncbi:MAG: MoaD/ThiS family protein [Gammaproteobacteria bacterium]|nr:MoaD/ThiS family protein [Gammaproteobacteria bacterium]